MRIAQEFPVWQGRWDALESYLTSITVDDATPRAGTLRILLKSLTAFGERQFNFFLDGFDGDKQRYHQLDLSAEFPIDYVLNTTLIQVSYDTDVLERAVQGRQDGGEKAAALELGDQLTHLSLQPAIDAKLIEPTVSLTYFQKSADIRVIPYAPVALVGVPRTVLKQTETLYRDYLAVPHEVGHYVFNHGRFEERSIIDYLRDLVANEPIWLQRWLEEIFADVYGAVVAGPAIAIDFQDMLLTHSRERFIHDDGDHPIEAIRPYIYSKALELLGFEAEAKVLNERWEKWLKQRKAPREFVPFGESESVNYALARHTLDNVVKRMMESVLKDSAEFQTSNNRFWLNPESPTAQSDQYERESLYDRFDAFVESLQSGQKSILPADAVLPELVEHDGPKVAVVATNGDTVNSRGLGLTDTWLDALTELDDKKEKLPMSSPVWLLVLSANNWATQGPNEAWPPD